MFFGAVLCVVFVLRWSEIMSLSSNAFVAMGRNPQIVLL
jgi:hypothetical protein